MRRLLTFLILTVPVLGFASDAAGVLSRALERVETGEGPWRNSRRLFGLLERRQTVRIAAIGGSITRGAGASCPDCRWPDRFVALLRRRFPDVRFELVNAGIGATGSRVGACRLKRDVLAYRPDLVVVEFSVNDGPTRDAAESYEGVLRQLTGDGREIAVVCLGMVDRRGTSAQEWHAQVARHYQVPFVSYRDAVWPLVEAGEIRWADISPDEVHPNDTGHDMAARLLFRCLMARFEGCRGTVDVSAFPQPLFGATYEHGEFIRMTDLVPTVNRGFFPLRDQMWGEGLACTNANGCLSFVVDAPTVAILYRRGCEPYQWGKVRISIDGKAIASALDCFGDQRWWHTPSLPLCKNNPGKHTVRIETLPEKNDISNGYGCHLTGLLVCRRKGE